MGEILRILPYVVAYLYKSDKRAARGMRRSAMPAANPKRREARSGVDKTSVQVRMLGDFSIACGDRIAGGTGSRSRKVWLLLAYLICTRGKMTARDDLIRVAGGGEKNVDPGAALRALLWRARRELEPLTEALGDELVVSRGGSWGWNPDVETALDAEEFERLCREARTPEDREKKLAAYEEALALWKGEFLEKFAMEEWVRPLNVYYRNLFLDALDEAVPLLNEKGDCEYSVRLCREALKLEPYHERLYQLLMRSLAAQGDFDGAARTYEDLRKLLGDEMGVMPSNETRMIYQEILHHTDDRRLSLEAIREQLHEQDPEGGALICDYAAFKLYYQAEARSASRRGDAIHIGILSVEGADGAALSKRSLDHAMNRLGDQIRESLRVGDVAARCSATQYVIMLVQANYENSEMVCTRVRQAFARNNPRSPARIDSTVLPLEPAFAPVEKPKGWQIYHALNQ